MKCTVFFTFSILIVIGVWQIQPIVAEQIDDLLNSIKCLVDTITTNIVLITCKTLATGSKTLIDIGSILGTFVNQTKCCIEALRTLRTIAACSDLYCLIDLICLVLCTVVELVWCVLSAIACIICNSSSLLSSCNPRKDCLCISLDQISDAVIKALNTIVTCVGCFFNNLGVDELIGACKKADPKTMNNLCNNFLYNSLCAFLSLLTCIINALTCLVNDLTCPLTGLPKCLEGKVAAVTENILTTCKVGNILCLLTNNVIVIATKLVSCTCVTGSVLGTVYKLISPLITCTSSITAIINPFLGIVCPSAVAQCAI